MPPRPLRSACLLPTPQPGEEITLYTQGSKEFNEVTFEKRERFGRRFGPDVEALGEAAEEPDVHRLVRLRALAILRAHRVDPIRGAVDRDRPNVPRAAEGERG